LEKNYNTTKKDEEDGIEKIDAAEKEDMLEDEIKENEDDEKV